MGTMKLVDLFIKEHRINILEMERLLGIPMRSIRRGRSIPKKHEEKVSGYLRRVYGLGEVMGINLEADDEEGNFEDGIYRYRDSRSGVWKRLVDWQGELDRDKSGVMTGKINLRDGYLPASGEVYRDEIGEYYTSRNGTKVYRFTKKK